jgi:hypothetical protein
MKPCSNQRKRIAWMAVGALGASEERALRQHLASCGGCSRYLQEIDGVKEALFAVKTRTDIESSESFHRRVVGVLEPEANGPTWRTATEQFRAAWLSWRLALPAMAATLVIIAALFVGPRRPGDLLSPSGHSPTRLDSKPKGDLAPTFSNYQRLANRSLDKFEELVNRQANRNPPSTMAYTASELKRAEGM